MDSSIAGRVRRPAPAAGGTAATPRRRVRGRSPGKRLAILAAARDLFLDKGFAGTSMDDVAARSGVSKQTVYAHFADKQRRFTELIRADVGQSDEPDHPMAATMGDTDDVARDLREYARWHLSVVLQPHRLRLRRTLIGEAERFPELARAWYENGPERSARIFAAWFRALDRRGVLAVPDPDLAAQHFNWLIVSIPVNKAMAGLLDGPLPTPELHRIADEGVRVFLAAYGVPQDHQTGATPACRPGA